MGEVARAGRERCGLERAVFGAEIDLGALMAAPRAERRFRPLPRFPAVRRDLALVIGREVRFEAIERVVRSVDSLPIADVQVFDRYAGAGIPAGQVGLASGPGDHGEAARERSRGPVAGRRGRLRRAKGTAGATHGRWRWRGRRWWWTCSRSTSWSRRSSRRRS
ncbi:MAG: hypothetical protein DMF50_11295 [Acidobacteria bacterium]|nr:MAG: hypothetical protein DMF50_11295 [Acidobacteriota bacterium]